MAEYYGKLKDSSDNKKKTGIGKILMFILFFMVVIVLICTLVGIFGDTARRDETRDIIRENSELKQQVGELTTENEELRQENEELREALEETETQSGTTLTKPEGDLSEEVQ